MASFQEATDQLRSHLRLLLQINLQIHHLNLEVEWIQDIIHGMMYTKLYTNHVYAFALLYVGKSESVRRWHYMLQFDMKFDSGIDTDNNGDPEFKMSMTESS